MIIVACLFCMQTALAADVWEYPTKANKPDGKFGGGNGTEQTPYLISTAQQLADLSYMVNEDISSYKGKYFKMTRDITLNDIEFGDDHKPTNPGSLKKWMHIGFWSELSNTGFEGIFDGDNHTVKGIYNVVGLENEMLSEAFGLFGVLEDAIVRNVNITDSYLECSSWRCRVGFVVGYMKRSQIINCHVSNSHFYHKMPYERTSYIIPTYIGGIAGQGSGKGKNIVSCSFDGTLTIDDPGDDNYVGGVMGLGASTLTDCHTSGTIEIRNCGFLKHYEMKATVAGLCYEAEDITGCTSRMNFKVASPLVSKYVNLWLYSLCYKAKNISKSAAIGSITIDCNEGWYADLGTVKKATSIRDCAFYTTVNGTFATKDQYDKSFAYYPLGSESSEDIGSVERVVLLNGDDAYFHTPDTKYLSRKEVVKPGTCTDFYELSADGLKQASVLANLNNGDKQTLVWGKVADEQSPFHDCPLPFACGGTDDSGKLKGEGTEAEPYLIGSEAELRILSSGVAAGTIATAGKFFDLTADIDMASSDVFPSIGTSGRPFRGAFNGRGHVVSNVKLENGLFGYLAGTVKNLAVVGAEMTQNDFFQGVLAKYLGDENSNGTLINCYAGGGITFKGSSSSSIFNTSMYFGGLCGTALRGNINDCYFKGSMHVGDYDSSKGYYIGGLIGRLYGTGVRVKDCYASFEADGGDKLHLFGLVGERNDKDGVNVGVIKDCYYVCDKATRYDNSGIEPDEDKVTRCDDDSKLLADYAYTDASAWMKGAFRPVLRSARRYAATPADGSETTVWLDAIPMTDEHNPSNDIFHFDGTAFEGDKLLWALPNLAIYDKTEKADYILNCTLAPKESLNYHKKSGADVETVKVNMHYPLTLKSYLTYYPLCLPGTVQRGDLPEGCRLLIGGKVHADDTGTYLNVVDADSVAGGVPFFAYVPSAITAGGGTLDIVMRSKMALEPLKQITYADGKTQEFDLTGTYQQVQNTPGWDELRVVDGTPRMVARSQSHAPFTSYLEAENGPELRDYLLLSDVSGETGKLLDEYDQMDTRMKLERTLHSGGWNTICLPFDMTAAEVATTFGTGTKVEKLTSVEAGTDGGCTLKFTAVTDKMEHGVPYLIKPTDTGGIYTLESCKLYNTLSPVAVDVVINGTTGIITLNGTFARKLLGVDSKDEYFIQDNKILHVGNGQQIVMNGFRAYITASAAAAKALAKARIMHGDGTVTSITLVEAGSSASGRHRIYDLQGIERKADGVQQRRGVYIKDGRKYVK